MEIYSLPELPYGYGDLAPAISEEQLTLHHSKHHAAYVKGANAILEKLETARKENAEIDAKALAKEFSFMLSGHLLHSLFWTNLAPAGKGGEAAGELKEMLEKEFGSLERFQKEFSQTATSCEGSGWAVLALDKISSKPIILQIEKHNVNLIPSLQILLALDVWEHAYYLDYKNDRAKFVENFWSVVNWNEVAKRV